MSLAPRAIAAAIAFTVFCGALIAGNWALARLIKLPPLTVREWIRVILIVALIFGGYWLLVHLLARYTT